MPISTLRETIKRYNLLSGGERVIAAVSGGIDSVVMLDMLLEVAEEFDLKISVCHLNHNLRGSESSADLEFVRALADARSLGFISETLDPGALALPGLSTQDAARRARYRFFEEAAGELGATRVALAHNMDDQAETVLMRFMAGAGLKGLSGIPPSRGIYIRPLIGLKRSAIEGYARAGKLGFVSDSSNESTKYLRNRIRLELIPEIERDYNPSIKESLCAFASRASTDADFIDKAARELFSRTVKKESDTSLTFDRGVLAAAHRSLSSRALFKAAARLKGDSLDIYNVHVESFLSLIDGKRPNAMLNLPGGLVVRREYDEIFIERGGALEDIDFSAELSAPGTALLPGASCEIRATVITRAPGPVDGTAGEAFFDMDKLCMPLVIRPFRAADRIRPLALGGTKKVKDLFIDEKVPALMRGRIPIVLSGDEIIWVAGLRQSEFAKITDSTTRVLRLEAAERTLGGGQ